jgi:hypothetical protein
MGRQKSDNETSARPKASARPHSGFEYEVHLTASAERAYQNFSIRAEEARIRGDLTSHHYTALNMIDEVLDKIIPRDPFNKRYALTGELSTLFRFQKGRLRICWVGSSALRRIQVVFISETLRKEGDANDPYHLLTKMVLSGQFNDVFKELGLDPPGKMRVQPFTKQ